MYCQAGHATSSEAVLLVTKRTFIEFRWADQEEAPQLRRTKSEPLLKHASNPLIVPYAKGDSKLMEPVTPTTCASENGDDVDDNLSIPDDVSEDQIVHFDTSSIRWADITECDSASVGEGLNEKKKDKKEDKRRSGRQRQRESRRRRMRTPSPEMRSEHLNLEVQIISRQAMWTESSWRHGAQTMNSQWLYALQ
jgi:hypothetical protein